MIDEIKMRLKKVRDPQNGKTTSLMQATVLYSTPYFVLSPFSRFNDMRQRKQSLDELIQ